MRLVGAKAVELIVHYANGQRGYIQLNNPEMEVTKHADISGGPATTTIAISSRELVTQHQIITSVGDDLDHILPSLY